MEGFVSFGMQKLWELLSLEYEQFGGVKDQVTELQTDLLTLNSFIKDAEAKKHTSATVKTCVEQIEEIIYDAENILETFLLKNKLRERSGIKNRVRRVACIIPEHKKIALEIKGISKRISKVIGDMEKLGVARTVADGSSIVQSIHDRKREMRQTFSNEYESDLVGLEENIDKLVDLMVEEENIQVVSLTGMGGVGKTTLARQIFNHEKVKHHFDGLAWVCVSQEFTRKYVWQTILQNLMPKEDGKIISVMTELELQSKLYQLLGKSKSLIVLDDVWKKEDWDLIKKILPSEKGSKVLLTSRKKSVAGPTNTRHINFQSECLSEENSWILLQRIAFPKRDESSELKVGEEMENMAKKMIKHCGRLPLAIKVLGGLLAENHTIGDWGRISKGIGSRILGGTNSEDNNNGSVDHLLSLSFEELPHYLKHCFLYLAHFPEDHIIHVEALSYYWAAEEIVTKLRYHNEETIRDVGNSYIEELVRRNMVIGGRKNTSLRFETCHLHDMMRELCLSRAKEENFLQVFDIYSPIANSQSHSTTRRLVIQNPKELHVERDLSSSKLRSLLIVMRDDMYRNLSGCLMESGLSFTRLQLLRVLDLEEACFEGGELPSSIGKLIHLRYLSLQNAKVSHLPSSLRNLKLLIYLNISILYDNIFVPNFLMEMQELRHLALPRLMDKKTKLELSNLVNLETLRAFSTKNSSLEDLHGMVRLRRLRMVVNDDETSIQSLYASILKLRNLEHLSIENDGSDRMNEEGLFVLDFIHLKHLVLDINIPRLPDVQQLPSNLTYIELCKCELEEDPMPILEKLPHLEVVCLFYKSFCGKRMVSSSSGFPQLNELKLRGYDLEEWIIEEGSMPLLRTLEIHRCENLKELPDGLRFINSLKDLEVDGKWEESMKEGGEDYYKVQHIPSLKFQWGFQITMKESELLRSYGKISGEDNKNKCFNFC